ncbi:hypothetical protein ACIBSW_22785 [Actinoplanes sp. NPDC049668]|uniref:hypothetical protein n=1 Tax=unclassified Actinoplanes TaxID=2626549 RepID=UPI00339F4B47
MPRDKEQLTVATVINPETRGVEWESRVEEYEDGVLVMPAPPEELEIALPADDDVINIAWNRPPHRYRVRAEMMASSKTRWRLRVVSDPVPVTRRTFFRGGGGETAQLRLQGDRSWRTAKVEDVSEAALRCYITDQHFTEGDPVDAKVELGDDILAVSGTVLLTRESDKANGNDAEVVITYTLAENQAQQVRRYLLEWQLAERRRAAAAED